MADKTDKTDKTNKPPEIDAYSLQEALNIISNALAAHTSILASIIHTLQANGIEFGDQPSSTKH